MSTYKTPEQIEFAGLFSQLETIGLRASDVARELRMTPAAVSMILAGDRSPRPLTLETMRRFVSQKTGLELSEDSVKYNVSGRADVFARLRGHVAEIENLLAEVKSTIKDLEK